MRAIFLSLVPLALAACTGAIEEPVSEGESPQAVSSLSVSSSSESSVNVSSLDAGSLDAGSLDAGSLGASSSQMSSAPNTPINNPPTQSASSTVAQPTSSSLPAAPVPSSSASSAPVAIEPSEPAPGVQVPAGFSRWSDPKSWGGKVPAAGSKVTIPTRKKILLDQDITLNRLQIDGELVCANQDLNITAATIMVHGAMTCGTAKKPFTKKLTITMTGKKPAKVDKSGNGMGNKVFGVMMGGVLNLHGQERTSWLNLGDTANKGATQITLDEAPNWRAGDKLVITSTSKSYKEAEVVTIKSINGRVVNLRSALKHKHFGEFQNFSNDKRNWKVNTRAEVGLLSRNIKFIGDVGSKDKKFGAHMMVMFNSEAYLSGLEMFRVGQYGIKGRYPFHWHLVGKADGQYIKQSAIYDSYNRCVTVHGTHNTRVEDNVCFKHVGHGFFLEDGIETGNVFHRNLGLWTIRPPEKDAILKSDFEKGPASQGPATFWISNGNNTFTDNVAAGSDGLGYWYDTEDKVTGPSASLPEAKNYSPRTSPFGKFKGNTVHSSRMALALCSRSRGRLGYKPRNMKGNGANIEDLTVYFGGIGAVWPCDHWHKFTNMKVLDTGDHPKISPSKAAFVSAFPAFVENSLFVSNSALAYGKPKPRAAFGIYDFGSRISDSHFVNYSEDNATSPIFVEVGGGVTFMYQSMDDITRDNSDLMMRVGGVTSKATTGNVIRDIDGSLSGKKNGRWSLVAKHALMIDSSCTKRSSADHGVFCPYYYAQMQLNMGVNNLPEVTVGRSDTKTTKKYQPNKARKFYKVFAALNNDKHHMIVDFKGTFKKELKSVKKIAAHLDYGLANDTMVMEFRNLKAGAKVSKKGWSKAASLKALKDSNGRMWYKNGNTITVKMKTTGKNKMLGAIDRVDITF